MIEIPGMGSRATPRVRPRRPGLRERVKATPSLRGRGVRTVRDLEQLLGVEQERDAVLDAASLLGFVGRTASVAPLGQLLASSTDPEARQVAGLSIGLIGGHEAVRMLIDALGEESCIDTRARLVDALAYPGLAEASGILRLGSPEALDDLLAVLSDPEPEIRFFAAYALGCSAPGRRSRRSRNSPPRTKASVAGFGSVAEEAREAIDAITGDEA